MEAWVPFFQSLIWPVFIAILIIANRRWLRDMLETIKDRVKAGSEVSVGPSGFSLGSAPKLDLPREEESKLLEEINAQIEQKRPIEERYIFALLQSVYLIHGATFFKQAGPTYDRRDLYTVKVQLTANSPAILDKVTKVVYHRHPSFGDKADLEVTNRASNFEMVMRLWGQFNLRADIYFKDSNQPLTLYRYLNF